MKLILSRKGFDAAAGGVASPIAPCGRMVSLPIRAAGATRSYAEITKGPDGTLGSLVEDLTQGRVPASALAHLDPDLGRDALPRRPGWRPAFGQTGAAATHLARSGVGPGDLFLFFGWFRAAERGRDGRWRFRPGSRDGHAVFGWLQVGERIAVNDWKRADLLRAKPWLADHPHVHFGQDPRNVVYVASDRLVLPGFGDTGLPGGGEIARFDERLVLSCPAAPGRSTWRLPAWFLPGEGRPALTYHGDPGRWEEVGDAARLAVVSQGQEFVLDCAQRPLAPAWVMQLLAGGPVRAEAA